LCLGVCLLLTEAQQNIRLKANEGRAEIMLGTFCTHTSTAELHFVLKLPQIMNVTHETEIDCEVVVGQRRHDIQNCRVAKPLLHVLFKLKRDANNLTRTELQRVHDIATSFDIENTTQTRQLRRSLLTGLGSLIGNVLGLATEDKVQHISETMKKIYDVTYKAASALDASGGKITKIIQAQNARIDHMSSLLQNEHNLTATVYREFNMMAVNFDISVQVTAQAIKFTASYIRSLTAITELTYGLHQLLAGKLTDEILPREALKTELFALKRELGDTLTVCHDDVSYYYTHASVKAFRNTDSLVITVEVPLSYYREKIFGVKILPIPLPSHLPGDNGYMQLRLDKNIFLYSKFHAVYTELDDTPNAATAIADLIGKPFFYVERT